MKKKRIVFMGTPPIAAAVLQKLIDLQEKENMEIVLAVSQPDKIQGRKRVLVKTPVHTLAQAHGIPVSAPAKLKQAYQDILDAAPDLIVTCAYGQMIPDEILETPVYGCINLHGSLLPEYRGGAPIQRAIWDGRKVSGMSLMKQVHEMDAGPVMAMQEIVLEDSDTSASAFEKMAACACSLLESHLSEILEGHAQYTEQDASRATFAPIIKKEEEHLDFSQEDERIANQIRALSLHPGAYVYTGKKKLKILEAVYKKERPGEYRTFFSPGKGQLAIGLKEGNLYLQKVQSEGRPLMSIKDFMNGQGKNLVGTSAE